MFPYPPPNGAQEASPRPCCTLDLRYHSGRPHHPLSADIRRMRSVRGRGGSEGVLQCPSEEADEGRRLKPEYEGEVKRQDRERWRVEGGHTREEREGDGRKKDLNRAEQE